jgi:hypothetical protein
MVRAECRVYEYTGVSLFGYSKTKNTVGKDTYGKTPPKAAQRKEAKLCVLTTT